MEKKKLFAAKEIMKFLETIFGPVTAFALTDFNYLCLSLSLAFAPTPFIIIKIECAMKYVT